MGSRMERHLKKNKLRKKKYRKFKYFSIILLTISLALILNRLDLELRASTSTSEKSIYSMNLDRGILNVELLGNNYYIDKEEIKIIFKNLKGTVKYLKDQIKDQSALVF